MSDVLQRICADKLDHVAAMKQRVSLSDLEKQSQEAARRFGYLGLFL